MHTIRSFLDLPRVNNQFEWKVNAILTLPTQNPAKWKDFVAYTRKDSPGVTIHTYTPKVFLNIQIMEHSSMKGTNYRDRWIGMDPKGMYRLKETLKKLYMGFQTKDLFFYENDVLKVNQEMINKRAETIPVGDKILKFGYAVIKDIDYGTGDFEGIVIFVNNYNIYMTLTYLEVGFMIDELEKLNLTQIGFRLIQGAMNMK